MSLPHQPPRRRLGCLAFETAPGPGHRPGPAIVNLVINLVFVRVIGRLGEHQRTDKCQAAPRSGRAQRQGFLPLSRRPARRAPRHEHPFLWRRLRANVVPGPDTHHVSASAAAGHARSLRRRRHATRVKSDHVHERRHRGSCRYEAATRAQRPLRVAKAALLGLALRCTALIRLSACAPTRRRHSKLAWRAHPRAYAASLARKAGSAPRQPIMRSSAYWEDRPSR